MKTPYAFHAVPDLEDPPAFVVARHGPLPEAWKANIRAAYGDLAPLRVGVPASALSDAQQHPGDAAAASGSVGTEAGHQAAANLVLDAVVAAAKAMPRWELVLTQRGTTTSSDLLVEAVATTRLMRFRDDIIIRVRAEATGRQEAVAGGSGMEAGAQMIVRVDVRSKSRLGKGDLGANAARIRAFLGKLRAELVAAELKPL
ncbi:hypothetical protein GPECTOR_63g15 [Gonium pectorale]|uniref:Uncharacterized protein n=1 Tax=Gonium pectorale TaxID=33097 RepID=A0A150G480_GONPE|nr:hypothetical protein GPECTOR_63g15 [Gonium pectorale]|eukprot:KXZ44686.1 hypothetical protein GPECTOR_63g15 [Gonium pectorale]